MRHKRPSQAGEGGGQSGALCRGLPASFDGSIGPAQVVGDLIFSPVGRAETGGGRGVGGIFFKSALEESDGAFYFFGRDVVLQIAQALDVVIICGGLRSALGNGGLLVLRRELEFHVGCDAFEDPVLQRSEERRVGKECRSRWSPY